MLESFYSVPALSYSAEVAEAEKMESMQNVELNG